MSKNLCGFCGRQSGTNAPFPRKELPGQWKIVVCPKCHSLDSIRLTERVRSLPEDFRETLIAQYKNELRRKMVSNDFMEIVFWFREDDSIAGFQLTFRLENGEDATLTWNEGKRPRFHRVYSERRRLLTNTLQPHAPFPEEEVRAQFEASAGNLRAEYRECVRHAIDLMESNATN